MSSAVFSKIMIANRGEIAVRVIQTCKRLGIQSVAVFSEIDQRSLHVRTADEAVYLGPSFSEESYLNKEEIIKAALETGCEAIHPGYGFLSENAHFAEMVTQSGLTFIGPSPSVIATLGDKIAAKALAVKAGVPTVPGHNEPLSDTSSIERIANRVGYPILLKPAAGGGGRGMRIVHKKEDLMEALTSAQEETRKAFSDDKLFIERFVECPRHIEIQIMADTFGNIVYLGERECSIQRRYQKVVEEAPSPILSPETRERLGELACSLACEASYVNAGTVEFILDSKGNFFFLEMNTRLQVEHPVTELVTGQDLVELQIQVAAGQPLPFGQEGISLNGWAIEARICAEDSEHHFLPSTGMITRYSEPKGRHVRIDSGISAGSNVSVYYDSMLAKAICWGKTREEARRRLVSALNRFHIEGVVCNVHFANAIINHPAFVKGDLSTRFLEEHFEQGKATLDSPREEWDFMAIAATLIFHNRQNLVRESLRPMIPRVGQVHEEPRWHDYVIKGEDRVFNIRLKGDMGSRKWDIITDSNRYNVETPPFEFYRRRLRLKIDEDTAYFMMQYKENFIWVTHCGLTQTFEIYTPREWELAHYMPQEKELDSNNHLISPMPGLIFEIKVTQGEQIYRGQDLVVIESMKMEIGVSSQRDGVVKEIVVKKGQAVDSGDLLITFEA